MGRLEVCDVLGGHPSNEEAEVAEVTIDRFLAKWPPPFGRIGPQREQEQFGGVPERRPPIVPEPAPVRHFEAPVERRGGGDAFVSEQWRRKLGRRGCRDGGHEAIPGDRKSTRLNSSH